MRDLDKVPDRHLRALEHGHDVGPCQLGLTRDVFGQASIQRETGCSGGEEPAGIRWHLDGIAVRSNLPCDADVMISVRHRDLLWPGRPRRRALTEERSEEHTSELQSRLHLVCRLLLEKKNK